MPAIARFQVRDRLGTGNQGTVYGCHDPQLGRPMAPGGRSEGDPLHEACLVSRLQHPNIVTITSLNRLVDLEDEEISTLAFHRQGLRPPQPRSGWPGPVRLPRQRRLLDPGHLA